jgi:hypothetical protein
VRVYSRKKVRRPEYIRPESWCLHHRGADEEVIREIVEVLATKEQSIEVPEANGPGLSHQEFRAAIRASIAKGHTQFIILLTVSFGGPAFRQTLWHLKKEFGATISFVPVRVEPCELGKPDWLWCDLAYLNDPEERKAEILRLAPQDPEISRCCG